MADPAQLNARTEAILRRLVRKDAGAPLRKVLAKARPEDVAAAMSHLTAEEQRRLYRTIDDKDAAASVLSHLEEDSVREITRDMSKDEVVDLLERMEPDDATDVVELLPAELRSRVVSDLETTEEAELAELLSWPPDSAGGIMSPVVFKMVETATCGEAIQELQQHSEELEAVFYVYIVDARERLVGVVSLRSLLVHPPSTPLVSIMHRDVIAVGASQDQEEVARVVARYDLLGVPVVDEDRKLLGIVTVDDVVDVIREEAAEDMMLMAGVQEEVDVVAQPVGKVARARGKWLVATLFGGLVAAELVGAFRDEITAVALLAAFMPVVMGMAGNIGTQSATIAVRGLATGRLEVAGVAQFLLRELRVGASLGLAFGLTLGLYGMFRDWPHWTHGIVVGLSLPISMTVASVWGASVPVVLSRLKVDPAVATGPFVTTTMDIIGILVYFSIARAVLGL
jgi:magnesium transporter